MSKLTERLWRGIVDAAGLTHGNSRRKASGAMSASIACLEQRVLMTGVDGWTQLQPSTDSRVIFVSSSEGSDLNDGLSEATPKATLAAAYSQVRNGYPDWVMLKSGDTFESPRLKLKKAGRSSQEMAVFTSYGDGDRPVIVGPGFEYWGANLGAGFSLDHVAITHLDFQGAGTGAKAIELAGGMNDVLIEGNVFSGHRIEVHVQYRQEHGVPASDVTIRRNVLTDATDQGLLASNITNMLVEENVFDHAGYGEGIGNPENVEGATIFKHNAYFDMTSGLTLRDNVFARGSNFGSKLASNSVGGFTDFVVDNNLYFNNGLSMDHSSSVVTTQETFVHERGQITNNVFTEIGRTFWNGSTQDMAAWVRNTKDVTWDSNIWAHKPLLAGNPLIHWGNDGNWHQNTTIQNSVVYNWDVGDQPESAYFETNVAQRHANLQLIDNQIDYPATDYLDPERTVGSYYASIGGTPDANAFLLALRNQSRSTWNEALTADAVNDYIREGFTTSTRLPVEFTAQRFGGVNALTNSTQVSWDVIFTAPVTGVDASDFQLDFSATDVSLSDGGDDNPATFTLTASGVPQGVLQVEGLTADNDIVDLQGHSVVAVRQEHSEDHHFIVDYTNPVPTISSVETATDTYLVTVDFDEIVMNFRPQDVVLTDAVLSNFQSIDGAVYQFTITREGTGPISVEIGDGAATDIFGNASVASVPQVISSPELTASFLRYETEEPTSGTYRFLVAFTSEPQNVDSSDFSLVTGGSVGSSPIVTVSDAGDDNPLTWVVTAESVTGAGSLGLAFSVLNDIVDQNSNAVHPTPTASEQWVVDSPRITSGVFIMFAGVVQTFMPPSTMQFFVAIWVQPDGTSLLAPTSSTTDAGNEFTGIEDQTVNLLDPALNSTSMGGITTTTSQLWPTQQLSAISGHQPWGLPQALQSSWQALDALFENPLELLFR